MFTFANLTFTLSSSYPCLRNLASHPVLIHPSILSGMEINLFGNPAFRKYHVFWSLPVTDRDSIHQCEVSVSLPRTSNSGISICTREFTFTNPLLMPALAIFTHMCRYLRVDNWLGTCDPFSDIIVLPEWSPLYASPLILQFSCLTGLLCSPRSFGRLFECSSTLFRFGSEFQQDNSPFNLQRHHLIFLQHNHC